MPTPAPSLPAVPRRLLVLLAATAIAATACDASVPPTPSPTSSPAVTAAPIPSAPSASPSAAPSPSASPVAAGPALADAQPGSVAQVVSGGLRVRTAPRVADDSVLLEPLLDAGTQLVVTGGPVAASGYTWYRVAPIGISLTVDTDGGSGNATEGWVAVADHDGTPWVAAATDPTPGIKLAVATGQRDPSSAPDAKAAAASVNAFGIALYRRLLADSAASPDHGLVVSPTSVMLALAMARAGANGATATQMDAVMRTPGWADLSAGLSSLDQLLASRNSAWDYGDGVHTLSLRIANTAFAQDGWPIEQAYLDRIARTFGAGVGLVDFANQTQAARAAINAWVARQTLGRIPELLRADDVSPSWRLALVNAVYLKAEWARAFDPDETAPSTFTTLEGRKVTVPTMHQTGDETLVRARGDGWQATELDYLGGTGESTPLVMDLILPDDLAAFEKSLSPKVLSSVWSGIASERRRNSVLTGDGSEMDCDTFPYQVKLSLPKFGIETRAHLEKLLDAMGMHDAMSSTAADFSGITTADRLFIGSVIHQANIDVDESGTTASAATSVGGDTTGGCGPAQGRSTVTLRFDRPFLFVLRDVQTNAVLFMGRVTDPTTR